MDPTNTWIPWKPVAIKKIDPKTESAIENLLKKYSKPCRSVKYTPKTKVIKSEGSIFLLNIIFMWERVTVAPLLTKTTVFKRGTENGLIAIRQKGGQTSPRSVAGIKE